MVARTIQMMLSLDKKVEQQSLAKYGLDFVTDTYLPEKLAEIGLGAKHNSIEG